jgi:anti-sigma-K factor RskA
MNGHPTREEDFDLFALGTLDDGEKQTLEAHLAGCSDCLRKVAQARGRIALLAFAAPRVEPSPELKDRLMRQIHATVKRDATEAIGETRLDRGRFGRWWAAVVVPVGAALVFASIFLWNENRRLDQQLARLRTALEQEQKQVEAARSVANLMAAPDTKVVALASMPGMPKGAARVAYNAQMGILVYDGQLESAPANKSYQLWLVPVTGVPISAGIVNSAGGETSYSMMKLAPGINAKAFAVTLEPAGGMSHPTGPQVLVGPVS